MPHTQKTHILRAQLLAAVALADGRYLDVEDEKAQSILANSRPDNQNAKQFHCLLTEMKKQLTLPVFDQDHMDLPVSAKIDLVKVCWEVAMCDGELHPEEEKLIYEVIDQLKVLRRDAVIAQQKAATP